MNWITYNLQGIAHLDQYLIHWLTEYGVRVYFLLFAIVFCETGIILTPFLPGDTLMFVSGALLADGFFHPILLPVVLMVAAFLGNAFNYGLGRFFGRTLLNSRWHWLIRKKYMDQTHAFFDRYGKKTIVLCRFIPIVRTFAPFVAGVGRMDCSVFMSFNLLGAVLWVGILGLIGYIFGHMPIVKAHFEWAIITVVVLSLLPGILALVSHRIKNRKNSQ